MHADEICPEVDGISYRPGVYKISMVRMFNKKLTNLRMYGSKFAPLQKCIGTINRG